MPDPLGPMTPEQLAFHRELEYLRAVGAKYRKRIGKSRKAKGGRARNPGKNQRWIEERRRKLDDRRR